MTADGCELCWCHWSAVQEVQPFSLHTVKTTLSAFVKVWSLSCCCVLFNDAAQKKVRMFESPALLMMSLFTYDVTVCLWCHCIWLLSRVPAGVGEPEPMWVAKRRGCCQATGRHPSLYGGWQVQVSSHRTTSGINSESLEKTEWACVCVSVCVCVDLSSAVGGVRSVGVLMLKVGRSLGLEATVPLLTVRHTSHDWWCHRSHVTYTSCFFTFCFYSLYLSVSLPVCLYRCVSLPAAVCPAVFSFRPLWVSSVWLQQGAVLVCGPGGHGALRYQTDRDASALYVQTLLILTLMGSCSLHSHLMCSSRFSHTLDSWTQPVIHLYFYQSRWILTCRTQQLWLVFVRFCSQCCV